MRWFKISSGKAAAQPKAEPVGPVVIPGLPEAAPQARTPGASPKAVFDTVRESPKAVFDPVEATLRSVLAAKQRTGAGSGFTIHASKDGETSETQRTSPTITVAKARMLFKSGWRVHIADAAGRHYAPSEFDELLKFDRNQ